MQRAGASHDRAVSQASAVAHLFLDLRKTEVPSAPATPELIGEPLPEAPADTKHVVTEFEHVPLGTFVASVQKAGRFKRLHQVGECSLQPGVDYGEFTVFGISKPHASQYTAVCRHCFKDGEPVHLSSSDESATSPSDCA